MSCVNLVGSTCEVTDEDCEFMNTKDWQSCEWFACGCPFFCDACNCDKEE